MGELLDQKYKNTFSRVVQIAIEEENYDKILDLSELGKAAIPFNNDPN